MEETVEGLRLKKEMWRIMETRRIKEGNSGKG